MTKTYLMWLRHLLVAAPFVFGYSALSSSKLWNLYPDWQLVLFAVGMALCIPSFYKMSAPVTGEKCHQFFERLALRQNGFLEKMPEKSVALAVFTSAALSLLLELSVIRWQSSALEFLAFFKNFGLIACFAGLGLGYSLSKATKIPILNTFLMLGLQILVVTSMQLSGITKAISKPPVVEQVAIRAVSSTGLEYWLVIYLILTFVFCSTALSFVPIGQLCGTLMSRLRSLASYGYNLLGSLFGVLTMTFLSYLCTPPIVWFGLCLLTCLVFAAYNTRGITLGAWATVLIMVSLGLPSAFGTIVVHSPYQVIEIDSGRHGWAVINAAGYYYQRVQDLSKAAVTAFPDLAPNADYYGLPYRMDPGAKEVLILGAGAGNDVAAALRAGAQHVDAVEIDPVIAQFGKKYHPERPYNDSRVNLILDDGRAFLRGTSRKYDAVVYALIDSHALSSSASSLRVDSYIYTVESFKTAKEHLNPHGIMAVSFVSVVPKLQRKVFLMMKKAFNDRDPLALSSDYDGSTSFFEGADGQLVVPADVEADRNLQRKKEFAATAESIDPSTDDWPFFYMPKRTFPLSYMPLIALVLMLSTALIKSLNPSRLDLNYMPFFWLGVGFMLVETKAVTELGLQFGNTWFVTAVVVAAVLSMAFISNLAVERLRLNNLILPGICLIASLAISAFVSQLGAVGLDRWAMAAILTCPIIFSGIVFSVLISRIQNIGSAMSMNILGALCGGLLEYSAMYFGYRALYFFAIAIYVAGFLSIYSTRKAVP